MNDNRKIGVIDSGVGGLTVAKEFRSLMPEEDILYLGDNRNVPYGNKTEEEIYLLTERMINFLLEKDVKLIAVACNTISSILDKHFLKCEIPLVGIIRPVTDYIIDEKIKKVGVVATEFTIQSGMYEKYLKERDPKIKVVSEPFKDLAEMIDKDRYSEEEILGEIDRHLNRMLQKENIKDIILGCTHYPIVLDKFKKVSKEINFINPAYRQTLHSRNILEAKGMLNSRKKSSFEIYTTGDKEIYSKLINRLGMEKADRVYERKEF